MLRNKIHDMKASVKQGNAMQRLAVKMTAVVILGIPLQ